MTGLNYTRNETQLGFIEGEGRHQATLFPVLLDDLIPADHMCRVIDVFVKKLPMAQLGFERARLPTRVGLAMIRVIS
jgi:hypothetical protein